MPVRSMGEGFFSMGDVRRLSYIFHQMEESPLSAPRLLNLWYLRICTLLPPGKPQLSQGHNYSAVGSLKMEGFLPHTKGQNARKATMPVEMGGIGRCCP